MLVTLMACIMLCTAAKAAGAVVKKQREAVIAKLATKAARAGRRRDVSGTAGGHRARTLVSGNGLSVCSYPDAFFLVLVLELMLASAGTQSRLVEPRVTQGPLVSSEEAVQSITIRRSLALHAATVVSAAAQTVGIRGATAGSSAAAAVSSTTNSSAGAAAVRVQLGTQIRIPAQQAKEELHARAVALLTGSGSAGGSGTSCAVDMHGDVEEGEEEDDAEVVELVTMPIPSQWSAVDGVAGLYDRRRSFVSPFAAQALIQVADEADDGSAAPAASADGQPRAAKLTKLQKAETRGTSCVCA